MSEEIKLDTFPASRNQAIALAWLQQQDLSKKTPTETFDLYNNAYHEIIDHINSGKIRRPVTF